MFAIPIFKNIFGLRGGGLENVMNNKVNYAVLGVGGFGIAHCMAINDNECANLVMVCDNVAEIAEKAGRDYSVKYTTDFDEVINSPEVDAICIVIPDPLHKEYVVKALKAGKHVLCEKPMALKYEECKEMVKVADESEKFLMVGQVCRFTPSFIKAKEIVESGEIGELFFIESEYAHDYAHVQTPWRYDPKHPRHGMIGGGCHAVDLMRWIAGDPVEVFGYSNKKVMKDCPTDDTIVAVMQFPNDIIGKVFCSTGVKRSGTLRTVIYGTKGTIIVDNGSKHITLYREEIEGNKVGYGVECERMELKIPVAVNSHNIKDEIKQFSECILTNTEPAVSGREGAKTVSICESIVKAADEHRLVRVDYGM